MLQPLFVQNLDGLQDRRELAILRVVLLSLSRNAFSDILRVYSMIITYISRSRVSGRSGCPTELFSCMGTSLLRFLNLVLEELIVNPRDFVWWSTLYELSIRAAVGQQVREPSWA